MDRTYVSDIAFSPSVKAQQEKHGSRAGYQKMDERGGWRHTVTDDLVEFLSTRDSFYLASSNAEGQPYIQHRGGPKGFLKPLDDKRLAFADFSGNRQYISIGNFVDNTKAFIFLMDYRNKRRIKIWGDVEVVEDDPELMSKLVVDDYQGKPERAFIFTIEAWDSNCPQHIVRRWSENEVAPLVDAMKKRIEILEAENEALRAKLEGS